MNPNESSPNVQDTKDLEVPNENETKEDPKQNCYLSLTADLKKHIEQLISKLNKMSWLCSCVDWILFCSTAACLLTISVGFSFSAEPPSSGPTQILATVALAVKSLEKSLDLSNKANTKQKQIGDLATLHQRIALMELNACMNTNYTFPVKDFEEIWSDVAKIEYSPFPIPPSTIATPVKMPVNLVVQNT